MNGKKRKFDQYDEKSPASCLDASQFNGICIFVMNRNEDERECRTCLLLLLLMFYINYEKNGERLCRLIIFVFYPSEWFEQMIISSKDVDHQDDDHHQ